MTNKYEQIPEKVVDLHGHTRAEAKRVLDDVFSDRSLRHVRIITGKGVFRETGPVLATFVKGYLNEHGFRYNLAKVRDGGEGAFEVFLR